MDYLYEGPLDYSYAQGIKNCDPNGPLIIYVSKLIPLSDSGRFITSRSVFSGTATASQKVRIMGPNYVVGKNVNLYEKHIQRVLFMLGPKPLSVTDLIFGN